MRGRAAAFVVVASVLAASACDKKPARSGAPDIAAVALGKGKVGELKKTLVAALTQALSQGVPAAIGVCTTEAPAIAGRLSADGSVVGRATRKPRNPTNLARGWQVEALARFETTVAAGKPLAGASFASRLPDGRTGYAEPLVIQELCLACHGTAIAPEVSAALAASYPDDQATGYQLGELRGIAWAELPVMTP